MLSASGLRFEVSGGRLLVLLTAVAVCLFGVSSTARAATITVNSTSDAALSNPAATSCSSTCSLREAVQVADNVGGASTITLPAGDYQLTLADTASGQTDDPAVGDLDVNTGVSLTITGAGSSATTIDANYIDRAFAVQSGGSLSLSGVTLEHGAQPSAAPSSDSIGPGEGGAIYNDGAVAVSSSVLTGNSAESGGGVVFSDTGATATSITNSTVTQNAADSEGGVAYVESGSVTLSGDTITHNSADSEGGVLSDDESGNTVGAVTISGSNISSNIADGEGGDLYVDEAGALSVTNSTLNGNATDDSDGGAVYDDQSGAISISGSTLSGNNAGDDEGGALYADDTGDTTISNSTFDSNSAGDEEGGAVYVDDGNVAVSGSTFDTDLGDEGGAIYVDGASATSPESITTSTFANDSATDEEGGAIDDEQGDLTVTRNTFTGDDASYYGGAFYYDSGAGLTLTNNTFDGNQANEGGAVYLDSTASTGTITILNDTIVRNTAYDGGGIANPQDANTIENTIVADNSGGTSTDGGGDCYGTAETDNAASADIGGNIDSDGSCFSSSVTDDHVGVNPGVGTLAANGSPLETDALLDGSPAIGTAIHSACPATDERGVTRPTACDSGAYQTQTADVGLVISAPSSGTVSAPLTYTLTATNNGPGAATGVTVTDTLPSGVTYFGSTSTEGSCSGTTTVSCSLGTLDSTETGTTTTATITITVIPTAGGSISDTAAVSTTSTDPVSSNNTASATTTVNALPGPQGPKVTTYVKPVTATGVASKVASKQAYLSALVNPAGQATTYTFQVRRQGTSAWRTVAGKTLSASTTVQKVGFVVRRLKTGKKYFFRVRATSSIGTSYGQQVVFHTAKAKKAKKK